MDRSKLEQLLSRRWSDFVPKKNADKLAEEISQVSIDNDVLSPPGQLVPTKPNASKLALLNVPVAPWSIFWIVLVSLTGGIGLLSFFTLMAVPPLPNCRQISLLSTDSERLYCAKVGAETNDKKQVLAAIDLVSSWPDSHPLYNDGKNLMNDWSHQLIKVTRKELVAGGNLDKAIENLNHIPPHSSAYADAQKTIKQWDKQWEIGEALEAKFKKALQEGDWSNGYATLSKIQALRSNYWKTTRHDQLSIQFAQEKEAWDKYEAAEVTAQDEDPDAYKTFRRAAKKIVIPTAATVSEPVVYSLNPDVLSKAIGIAYQIPASTYIKKRVQAKRELWSQTLLAIATEKFNVQKYNESLAAANKVPRDVTAFKAAQALAKNSSGRSEPVPSASLLALPPDNQSVIVQAQKIAQIGSIESLNQAVAIVSRLPAAQPLAKEAQTNILAWNRQIQAIKDQPILDAARTQANQGKLTTAIATVAQLPSDSAAARSIQNEVRFWKELLVQREERKKEKERKSQQKSSKTLVPAG